MRVSALLQNSDGHFKNRVNGKRLNGEDIDTVRATLVWTPTEAIEATLIGSWLEERSDAPGGDDRSDPDQLLRAVFGFVEPDDGAFTVGRDALAFHDTDQNSLTAIVDWDLGTFTMQIDEPDYGTLLDDMIFESGSTLEAARYPDPRLEVELAFVLDRALDQHDASIGAILAATRHVVPALELIAARSHRVDPETGKPRGILDTVADNAASAGVIMGEPFSPDEVDMRWCGAILMRNGIVEETGLAAGVLDHPANGALWLIRRFAAHGVTLDAGQIILTGSFTRPVAVRPEDEFVADYGRHGVITCRFE